VVKDNHLTEQGTHDELLSAGGFYAELHGIQLGEPVMQTVSYAYVHAVLARCAIQN
jgi:hypothetical protein